jgi:hypothetical protein
MFCTRNGERRVPAEIRTDTYANKGDTTVVHGACTSERKAVLVGIWFFEHISGGVVRCVQYVLDGEGDW